MKRSIKSLVAKMNISDSNQITGGFGQIRGGNNLLSVPGPNSSCSNTGAVCGGDNTGSCSNSQNCTGANINGGPESCSNHRYCS